MFAGERCLSMPSHETHCRDSQSKYGKRFDDLHSWMDEPRDILGRKHRMFRHDPETTPQEAKRLFGEFADHACLDHIGLDRQSSDEISERIMDTGFCQCWQGDEKSKYCRQCAQPRDACYELWERVCQLAANRLEFTNNRQGKAFGNRYRLESPSGKICYLQMLQGARSRFQLPIEDFLYVTITGRGGVNETPSGTRQYPFVDLLLEIIASDPEGESLIIQARSPSARAEMDDPPDSADLPNDWWAEEELLGSDDSHFYESVRSTAERVKTTERTEAEKPSTGENGPAILQDQLLLKRSNGALVGFAILFYAAYSVLCLLTAGVFITASMLGVSAVAVGIGLTAERRYSLSDRADRAATVLLFLFCFLFLTIFFLEGIPFPFRFLIFVAGLASTLIVVRGMLRGP